MYKLISKFVDYLILNNITSENMREVDIYSFEVIIGKMLNYGTLLLLSWMNGNILQTLVFMIVFFSLRSRNGGFHAKKFLHCYFGTIAIYFCVLNMIVPAIKAHKYMHLYVMTISNITVYLFAPINHPNLQLNDDEIRLCKKSARRLIIGLSIGVIVLTKLSIISEYTYYMLAGMGVNTGLLLIAKILKQEVRKDEKNERKDVEKCC